mgnify:CR=1 FL=1
MENNTKNKRLVVVLALIFVALILASANEEIMVTIEILKGPLGLTVRLLRETFVFDLIVALILFGLGWIILKLYRLILRKK